MAAARVGLAQANARQQQADAGPLGAAVEAGGVDLHRHAAVSGNARQHPGWQPGAGSNKAGSGSAIGPGVSRPGWSLGGVTELAVPVMIRGRTTAADGGAAVGRPGEAGGR